MEYQGLSFVEAVHELAKMVGLQVTQVQATPEAREQAHAQQKVAASLQGVLQQAADYYKAELKKSPRAIEYLKARGLSGKTVSYTHLDVYKRQIVDVFETGANDVLVVKADVVQPELAKSASDKVVEVKNEKPQERLLPFIASVVLEVDLKAQTMLVDWDEDF